MREWTSRVKTGKMRIKGRVRMQGKLKTVKWGGWEGKRGMKKRKKVEESV